MAAVPFGNGNNHALLTTTHTEGLELMAQGVSRGETSNRTGRRPEREAVEEKKEWQTTVAHSAANRSLGRPAGMRKQSCTKRSLVPSVNSSQAHFADLLLQLYYRDSHVWEQIGEQTKVLRYPHQQT